MYHFTRLARALCLFAALALSANNAFAEECTAGEWTSPPDSVWDSLNASFPVRAESEHFQIRWDTARADISEEQARLTLIELEAVYDWFISDAVGWPTPFCNESTKFKVQIFANRDYGLAGAGAGRNYPAMWVNDGAIRAAARGEISGMVHEFTHTMQFNSGGLRGGVLPGAMWESHAEFMAHAYPGNPNKTGCSEIGAWQPHLHYLTTRVRYCQWMFWDMIKSEPDLGMQAVSNIWRSTAFVGNQDPIKAFRDSNNLSQTQLGDLFGRYAMKNVNWDYVDPDGLDRGPIYRNYYRRTDSFDNENEAIFIRRARMEAIDLDKRQFAVSRYWAPNRYGHNHVMLIPDDGATEINIEFRGIVQTAKKPGAQSGVLDFEPGKPDSQWSGFAVPEDPASNWRWGVVAVNDRDESRYSELKSGPNGTLTFPLQGDERAVFLAVAATPNAHHSIFWEQLYHTLYRYPYRIQLSGAMPEGYEANYRREARFERFGSGRYHPNGGGWVADRASVEPSVYVAPNAGITGGSVGGNARIEDYAVVHSGTVSGNAIIGGLTQFNRDIEATENAVIRVTVADGHTWESNRGTIAGSTRLYGDLIFTGFADAAPLTQGAFTGLLNPDRYNTVDYGLNQANIPEEVTAPYALTWGEPDNSVYPTRILNPSRWSLLSIPADPASTGTLQNLFGDDLPVEQYGASGVWVVYSYDSQAGQYRTVAPDEPLQANTAYWFYHGLSEPVEIDLPPTLQPLSGSAIPGCIDGQQCVAVPLSNNGGGGTWNFVGYSSDSQTRFGDTRFVTASGDCVNGCTPAAAQAAEVAYDRLYRLNSDGDAYELVTENTPMLPWDGYWLLTMPGADQPRWVVPLETKTSAPPADAILCSSENGECAIPSGQTATVWYGSGNSWNTRSNVSGSITCNNDAFGDPIAGVFKSCRYIAD